MKGYEQTCPQVEAIGQINFHGDGVFTPNNWYHNIRRSNGKTYLEAVILLADIVSWYLPIYERDEITGKTIGVRKKFKADKLQRNYDSFADHYGMTKDQARNALKHLEKEGLIDLELRTVETPIQKLGNVLFVGVHPEKIRSYTFTLLEIEPTPIPTETDRGTDRKAEGSAQKQTGLPSETQTNTDQSTDPSTDQSTKEERADDFFTIAPSSLNQENSFPVQTAPRIEETPTPPTPASPLPENKPKKVYTDPMGDRFRQGKPKHRYSTLVSSNPEWQVLDNWCTGKQLGDFKPSLIKATIAHLKKWEHPFEAGDAINCLSGYIKRRDLDGFEGRIKDALKIENQEAIATQQNQVEQQRFQEPATDDSTPTMTVEQRKQYAADLRRRQAQRKLVA